MRSIAFTQIRQQLICSLLQIRRNHFLIQRDLLTRLRHPFKSPPAKDIHPFYEFPPKPTKNPPVISPPFPRSTERPIVLHVWPRFERETVCWVLFHVLCKRKRILRQPKNLCAYQSFVRWSNNLCYVTFLLLNTSNVTTLISNLQCGSFNISRLAYQQNEVVLTTERNYNYKVFLQTCMEGGDKKTCDLSFPCVSSPWLLRLLGT